MFFCLLLLGGEDGRLLAFNLENQFAWKWKISAQQSFFLRSATRQFLAILLKKREIAYWFSSSSTIFHNFKLSRSSFSRRFFYSLWKSHRRMAFQIGIGVRWKRRKEEFKSMRITISILFNKSGKQLSGRRKRKKELWEPFEAIFNSSLPFLATSNRQNKAVGGREEEAYKKEELRDLFLFLFSTPLAPAWFEIFIQLFFFFPRSMPPCFVR